MVDIERIITPRIQRSKQYLAPQVNPAIKAHHEAMIRVLQTVTRDESAIAKVIEQKKQDLHRTRDVIEAEPLHNELDALEWLHALVVASKINSISAESIV